MGKIRRGNYVFLSWKGDHGRHVHVYRDGKQILKWGLGERKAIKGKANQRILKIIERLEKEDRL